MVGADDIGRAYLGHAARLIFMPLHQHLTHSPTETHALGVRIGAAAVPGTVIALDGPLGAGKTALTIGLAQGLGVPAHIVVNSPTYVLMNEYPGRVPVYHFDWYRLEHAAQLAALDLDEYLYGDGVAIIEWANRFPERLPADAWRIDMAIVDADTRRLDVFSQIAF